MSEHTEETVHNLVVREEFEVEVPGHRNKVFRVGERVTVTVHEDRDRRPTVRASHPAPWLGHRDYELAREELHCLDEEDA